MYEFNLQIQFTCDQLPEKSIKALEEIGNNPDLNDLSVDRIDNVQPGIFTAPNVIIYAEDEETAHKKAIAAFRSVGFFPGSIVTISQDAEEKTTSNDEGTEGHELILAHIRSTEGTGIIRKKIQDAGLTIAHMKSIAPIITEFGFDMIVGGPDLPEVVVYRKLSELGLYIVKMESPAKMTSEITPQPQ